jgi:Fe-S-cluster containining protein
MTARQKQPLIETLQENVSLFFEKFQEKHADHMQCGRGCAKCCRVALNIFPVEAQRVYDWWCLLSRESRQEIVEAWKTQSYGETESPVCVFLVKEKCTIYDSRPVICRSQGAPLKVFAAVSSEEDEPSVELSLCELNFKEQDKLPVVAEWLDLERLNTLLSIAQQQSQMRYISEEINQIRNDEGERVSMSKLKSLLLQNT